MSFKLGLIKRIGFTPLHEDKKTPTHLGGFTSFSFCLLCFIFCELVALLFCDLHCHFFFPPSFSFSVIFSFVFYLSLLVSCVVVFAYCHHHSSSCSCSSHCTLTFAHLVLLLLLFILSHFSNFHLVTFCGVMSCSCLFHCTLINFFAFMFFIGLSEMTLCAHFALVVN